MITAIHHLDCCTLCPVGGKAMWGDKARMCSHVLLLETTSQGLVLVDTGVGLADRRNRMDQLGFFGVLGAFPTTDEGAAVGEITRLGLDPADVRHVVLTHFDLDHAGGIGDVPQAKVHLLTPELEAARAPSSRERIRYRRAHVQAVQHWVPYAPTGEAWHGFPAVQEVDGLDGDVLLVPLSGHTRGHACVAVRTADGWLLHAGDAYFHRGTVTSSPVPPGFSTFERLAAHDWARVRDNHARLAEVIRDDPELRVFCAHDPNELEALQGEPS